MNKKQYTYPDFNNSLVNVPHSILGHFALPHTKPALKTPLLKEIKECSKVVFFLVDGFGYNLFKKTAANFPFFKKINDQKFYKKITTIFPSTTAAGITTVQSGITPREHGLFKWHVYFDELDLILQPLPYQPVPTEFHTPIILPKDTKMLFSATTLYESLGDGGVPSYYFIPKQFRDNVFTKAVSKGATLVPYISIIDLFIELRKLLEQTKGNVFCYVYWGSIDGQEHMYGPWSEQTESEIKLFDSMIQEEFINKLDKTTLNETALMLTADHGQTQIDAYEMVYLNDYPQITQHFMKSSNGLPILPTGNPRDTFLHIKKEKLDETVATLQQLFGDFADIIKLDEATIDQLFGREKEHTKFSSRLGNVLILPKGKKCIWYRYLPTQKVEYHGHHGGLTEDEMYIPFITAPLTKLK